MIQTLITFIIGFVIPIITIYRIHVYMNDVSYK